MHAIKSIMTSTSSKMGRLSFPSLVTLQGKTIYHPVQAKYKQRDLQDVGVDISRYEWYEGFDEFVRGPLLDGKTGTSPVIQIQRALAAGTGGSTSIPDITRVDTKYFYRPTASYQFALFFAYDIDELESVVSFF
jgi:hypothetical protein